MASRGIRAYSTVRGLTVLSNSTLSQCPSAVTVPTYDRSRVTPSIVHMGVGGFHRSHMAVYCDDLLQQGGDWGICGVGLLDVDSSMRDAMCGQDGLYTVISRDATGSEVMVVGSLLEYIFAPEQREAVLGKLTHADTKIVSITVTEKGYGHDPITGSLDLDHPAIKHDLEHPRQPISAGGLIVEALRQRHEAQQGPFTVLSCDNLQGNGHIAKQVVLQLADTVGPTGLRAWIEENATFPNSMVDRITPATEDKDREWLAENHGVQDAWPVVCEQYRQWVLEDEFCTGRPAWEDAGAMFVADVFPYELMKLRLLNTSHSALAYLSYLADHRSVDGAMGDASVGGFVAAYMGEVQPSCLPVPGVDIAEYKGVLCERFANPGVKDQVQRLAEDGSTKIGNQMVPIVLDNLKAGRSNECLAASMAAYMSYMTGLDMHGAPIAIKDAKLDTLQPLAIEATKSGNGSQFVAAAFGDELAAAQSFMSSFDQASSTLAKAGPRALMDKYR